MPLLASSDVESIVGKVEAAHEKDAWYAQKAIAADIELIFGGQPRFSGRMTMNPAASETRLEIEGGPTIVFDGSTCWVSPPDSGMEKPRFHALTWPYFLAAPYKLGDPGVNLEYLGEKELAGKVMDAMKMTFEPGTGDAPDDWYIVYSDQQTGVLEGMAYIVTYGTPTDKAEEDPHAITYGEFGEVDGIPIPMHWKFWTWRENEGITGDMLGEVKLSGVGFIEPDEGTFSKPDGAGEVSLP